MGTMIRLPFEIDARRPACRRESSAGATWRPRDTPPPVGVIPSPLTLSPAPMETRPDSTGNYERALTNAEIGYVSVPCRPGTKIPLVKWKPLQTQPPTAEQYRAWFQATRNNIAIITTGLVVFDCDDPALADLVVEHCGDTPCKVRTPRGGIHLLYRRGPGSWSATTSRSTAAPSTCGPRTAWNSSPARRRSTEPIRGLEKGSDRDRNCPSPGSAGRASASAGGRVERRLQKGSPTFQSLAVAPRLPGEGRGRRLRSGRPQRHLPRGLHPHAALLSGLPGGLAALVGVERALLAPVVRTRTAPQARRRDQAARLRTARQRQPGLPLVGRRGSGPDDSGRSRHWEVAA